jgi:hypothetical protein
MIREILQLLKRIRFDDIKPFVLQLALLIILVIELVKFIIFLVRR